MQFRNPRAIVVTTLEVHTGKKRAMVIYSDSDSDSSQKVVVIKLRIITSFKYLYIYLAITCCFTFHFHRYCCALLAVLLGVIAVIGFF